MRTTIALALGMAEAKVRVVHPAIGGGFGVKTHIYPEDMVVPWISLTLGQPVRWIEDRMENLVASVHAREQRHDVALAYDDDGTIRAVRCMSTLDLGSGEIVIPGVSPVFVTNVCLSGSNDLANVATRTVAAVTDKIPSGAYRGFGVPESTFVMERIIDRVARHTGTDRVELRRRMLLRPAQLPYVMHGGGRVDSGAHAECFERALEVAAPALTRARSAHADDPDVRVGVGYANCIEPTSPSCFLTTGHWAGGDAATVRVDPDGSVRIAAGRSAIGQGAETAAAQLAADALGVSPEGVTVVLGDTERSPYGLGSWGSRGHRSLGPHGGPARRHGSRPGDVWLFPAGERGARARWRRQGQFGCGLVERHAHRDCQRADQHRRSGHRGFHRVSRLRHHHQPGDRGGLVLCP